MRMPPDEHGQFRRRVMDHYEQVFRSRTPAKDITDIDPGNRVTFTDLKAKFPELEATDRDWITPEARKVMRRLMKEYPDEAWHMVRLKKDLTPGDVHVPSMDIGRKEKRRQRAEKDMTLWVLAQLEDRVRYMGKRRQLGRAGTVEYWDVLVEEGVWERLEHRWNVTRCLRRIYEVQNSS